MDNNKVSVIAVNIIHTANIDLKSLRNYLSKICQGSHDVRG